MDTKKKKSTLPFELLMSSRACTVVSILHIKYTLNDRRQRRTITVRIRVYNFNTSTVLH